MPFTDMVLLWCESRFTEKGKGGAICGKKAAAWLFGVIKGSKMVKMPKYSFQCIRAKLCALLVEGRSSWGQRIHVEEIQQFIFCAGGALGNKERDKLIGREFPVPCQGSVRIGKFGDYG